MPEEWIFLPLTTAHHISRIVEIDEMVMVEEEAEIQTSKQFLTLPRSPYAETSLRIRDRWQSRAPSQSRHGHSEGD